MDQSGNHVSGNHVLLRGGQSAAADRMRDLLARTVQEQATDQRSNVAR